MVDVRKPFVASRSYQQRVAPLAEALARPVDRFLQQPGDEARACFQKIFDSFRDSPLLGLSALGGLVALFAYAKAVLALEDFSVDGAALISAGDVADFAIRLAVPFILLVVALAAVVGGWIAILWWDHRRGARYWCSPVAFLALLAASLVLLALWAPPDGRKWGVVLAAIALGAGVLVIPAGFLAYVGRKDGVKWDDRLQRCLLFVLRGFAHPLGILAGFAVLGLCLLEMTSTSVLFDRGLSASASSSASGCSDDLMVLEAKSYPLPVVVRKRMARLGSMWLLERVEYGKPNPNQSCYIRAAVPQWIMLRQDDVTCVRPFDVGESVKGFKRECPNEVGTRPPPVVVSAPPESIAEYAHRILGCDDQAFEDPSVNSLVAKFRTDEPETTSGALRSAATIAKEFRSLPMPRLRVLGLGALREATSSPVGFSSGWRLNEGNPVIWVLGFASIAGRSSSNEDLSERRAFAVKKAIERAALLDPNLIKYRGLGSNLIAGTASPQQSEEEQVAVAFVCRPAAIGAIAARTKD
jgi:hypothetical protein